MQGVETSLWNLSISQLPEGTLSSALTVPILEALRSSTGADGAIGVWDKECVQTCLLPGPWSLWRRACWIGRQSIQWGGWCKGSGNEGACSSRPSTVTSRSLSSESGIKHQTGVAFSVFTQLTVGASMQPCYLSASSLSHKVTPSGCSTVVSMECSHRRCSVMYMQILHSFRPTSGLWGHKGEVARNRLALSQDVRAIKLPIFEWQNHCTRINLMDLSSP